MLFEIALAILLGICIGIITGLVPGVHINLVAALLISSAPFLLTIVSVFSVSAFIIALAVTHTFLDALPGIYLGAPNAEEILSILPGHKFLLAGNGHGAVLLTLVGSLLSLFLAILLFPLSVYALQWSYAYIKEWIGIILVVLAVILILKESNSKILALSIFLLSGLLGYLSMNSGIREPLLPLLSGLFGISILFVSIFEENNIPEQVITTRIQSSAKIKAIGFSFVGGLLGSFLPGVGASQIAVAGSDTVKGMKEEEHLIISGGLNAAGIIMSIATFYAIEKERNGAIIALSTFLGHIGWLSVILLLGSALIAAGVATLLAIRCSKIFCRMIKVVDYRKLCIGVMVFIVLLVSYFSRLPGLLVLFASVSLGIFTNVSGVRKSHMMGCLMIPVMVYFLL